MSSNKKTLSNSAVWIDVMAPEEAELKNLSREYQLDEHQVLNWLQPDQLPSFEKVGDFHFLMTRLFTADPGLHVHTLQELTDRIAIFYNEYLIITIHKNELAFLNDVTCKKVDDGSCNSATDVLAIIMLHILKSFEHAALKLSEQIDHYEDTILLKTLKPPMLKGLYYLKRKAGICKRLIILTGDVINFVNSQPVEENLLRDITDLQMEIENWFDQVLDDVNNLLNTYLSLSAHKTNDVMKILTVFSVFFMPLTFIVGVYGMNFKFMPELEVRWGYPAVWVVMGLTVIAVFIWIKKKKWI